MRTSLQRTVSVSFLSYLGFTLSLSVHLETFSLDFILSYFNINNNLINFTQIFYLNHKVQEVVLKDSPNETKDPEGGCAC